MSNVNKSCLSSFFLRAAAAGQIQSIPIIIPHCSQVLEQVGRVGVRRAVLGGLHVRRDALRPGQEPRGGGEGSEGADFVAATVMPASGLRGEPVTTVHCCEDRHGNKRM